MQPADTTSVTVVEVVPPRTRETSVADVLLSSLGIVAVALIGAFLVGAIWGGILIGFKRLFPGNAFNGQNADDMSLRLSGGPPRD